MPEWTQNAHPVEGIGTARLGESVARLAGNGRMIQIAAQIRILVAVEAIDGRKYAPSIDMRSRAVPTRRTGHLRDSGRRITGATVWAEAWRATYPAAGNDRIVRWAEPETRWPRACLWDWLSDRPTCCAGCRGRCM